MTNAKPFPSPSLHEIIEQYSQNLCSPKNQSKAFNQTTSIIKQYPQEPKLWAMLDKAIPSMLRKTECASNIPAKELNKLFVAYLEGYPANKIPPASYDIAVFGLLHSEVIQPEGGVNLSTQCVSKACTFLLGLSQKYRYYDLRESYQWLDSAEFDNAGLYACLVLLKLGMLCYRTRDPLPHGLTSSLPKELDTGWKMMMAAKRHLWDICVNYSLIKPRWSYTQLYTRSFGVSKPIQIRVAMSECNSDGLELCRALIQYGIIWSPNRTQRIPLSPERQEELAFNWVHQI